MNQKYCNIILVSTIKNTTASMIAHHIVGVQTFFLWSLKNSVAFHIVAFSLICFPSLNSFKNSMNSGVIKNPIKNVASQKEKIKIRCEFISVYFYRLLWSIFYKNNY